MPRRRALIALLTLLTVLGLAACAQGAATTAPTAGATAAPAQPDPDQGDANDAVLAFIRAADTSGGALRLVVDPIEMLTGQEAVDAAHEDGQLDPAEDSLPNDFYIRNLEETTRELTATDDVTILPIAVVGEPTPELWSAQELARIIGDGTGPAMSPYLLTVAGGQVTEIREVYIP